MKIRKQHFLITALILSSISSWAQLANVESKVYKWRELIESPTTNGLKYKIFKGSTATLAELEMNGWTLDPGQDFLFPINNKEHLIIVQRGILDVVAYTLHRLNPGSIGLLNPGEDIFISNNSEEPVTFYLMSYTAKEPKVIVPDSLKRPFFVLWDNIEYKTHDRGGIRNYFNTPTVMTEYFEMHVTNLNGLIKSHEPHTHEAAEIVLMIGGNTEMQIGEEFYQGTTGDVYYLGSDVPHAIRNLNDQQCQYFAFQWK